MYKFISRAKVERRTLTLAITVRLVMVLRIYER